MRSGSDAPVEAAVTAEEDEVPRRYVSEPLPDSASEAGDHQGSRGGTPASNEDAPSSDDENNDEGKDKERVSAVRMSSVFVF